MAKEEMSPEEEQFWEALDSAERAVKAGKEPGTELEHAVFAGKLIPHGVKETDYDEARRYPLPEPPTDVLENLHFTFQVPLAEYTPTKKSRERITRLKEETLKTVDRDRLLDDLKGAGITIRKPNADRLFNAALQLQKRFDRGEDVSDLLHRTQLATAIERDSQISQNLSSEDLGTITNALVQLHQDRFNDVRDELAMHPERLSELRDHYSKKLAISKEKLPLNPEDARSAATKSSMVNELPKEVKENKSARKAAVKNITRYQKLHDPESHQLNQEHGSFRKAAKKLVEGVRSKSGERTLTVHADFRPSRRHYFAGAISGDCAKCNERELIKDGLIVGSLFEQAAGRPKELIGSAYLATGKAEGRPVIHLDALQPYASKAEQSVLAKEFVAHLLKNADSRFHAVTANETSSLKSNHASTQRGFQRAFPNQDRTSVSFDRRIRRMQSRNTGHVVLMKRWGRKK